MRALKTPRWCRPSACRGNPTCPVHIVSLSPQIAVTHPNAPRPCIRRYQGCWERGSCRRRRSTPSGPSSGSTCVGSPSSLVPCVSLTLRLPMLHALRFHPAFDLASRCAYGVGKLLGTKGFVLFHLTRAGSMWRAAVHVSIRGHCATARR